MTLGSLVCGAPTAAGLASTTLDHLSASIDRFSGKATAYLNNPFDEDAQSFGAFCARVTLENACAALVGRLDSFRMLYLAEFQAQGGYEYGKPTKSGFKWTGDVFSEDKPLPTLWNSDHDSSRVSRALFSQHVDVVHWQPAFNEALDYIASEGLSGFEEMLSTDASSFIPIAKGRCGPLYSKLSKGVHWDFFVASVIMDEGTLKDAIRDCLTVVSNLAFVSHFIPTCYRSLDPAQAAAEYLSFRETFQ